MVTTRQPYPGEKCVCGDLAVIVYVKRMGEVPSCVLPQVGKIKPKEGHGARPVGGER